MDTEKEEAPQEEETPEVAPIEATPEEKLRTELQVERDARIKAEARAEVLKEVRPVAPISSTRQYSDEEKIKMAEDNGFPSVEAMEATIRLANGMTAPIQAKLDALEKAGAVDKRVSVAKKVAASDEPQFSKLEGHVDEYMQDVSVEDKLDPDKLDRHLKRAMVYARGALGAKAPTRRAPVASPKPAAKEDTVETEGNEYFGVHSDSGGKFRMVTKKLVPDDYRKRHTHPEIDGGVKIDSTDEWEQAMPRFGDGK